MKTIFTDKLSYNKETKTFCCEASDIRTFDFKINKVVNKKTNNSVDFFFSHRDTDSTGEDVYGWNFKSKCGLRLLIIND